MATNLVRVVFICLFALSGLVSPATALEPEARIRQVEAEIRHSRTEIGVLFYEDGTELTRWAGTCCYTKIDFDEYWRLWSKYWAKVIFTHSHPRGTAWYFSKADVNFGILYRVAEMRVVGWRGGIPWLCTFKRSNFEHYPGREYYSQWAVFFARVGMEYKCERVD